MPAGIAEKEILQMALRRLEETTGLTTEVFRDVGREDPEAEIRIIWQDMKWRFEAEVIQAITRGMVGAVVQRLRRNFNKGILITKYITPQVAEILKETGIPFLDAAGNAYLNEPPLFIFVKGNRPVGQFARRPPIRAFRPTGMQVVFAFLCNPGLEKGRYREIAKTADVALGTVGWVMRDLRQMGNLLEMGKRGRRLVQKEELLARWATAYPEQLRPKKVLGTFRAAKPDWWKECELPGPGTYWGGEIAGARFTGLLKPQTVTIYTRELKGLMAWLIRNRLRQEAGGDIEIMKLFWNFPPDPKYPDLTHPVLTYADLLATADARNIEAARIIYETRIARLVRED